MNKPTNVTSDVLYDALARFGPLGAAQLGYFNALASVDGQPSNVTVNVQVTAPENPIYEFPPHYGYGELDLSAYNLTEPPTLSGVVIDPVEGVSSYGVNFFDVTTTSAKVHSYYGQTADTEDRAALRNFSQTVRVRIN